ncbi:Ribosomal RNA small subunit methyltransferase A [Candidatus Johnevansia muelleri]|uniref:Ribosomal RNA small subunit methyltransferase A n=1 Tax=Candidatus Johnevansia muelleri TaxID=1495769 RepID=A0A078KEW1_9GAMM|nr:Ribosomal RNA small subunit methyltransferase A [Candidatus Evansia muelleri]
MIKNFLSIKLYPFIIKKNLSQTFLCDIKIINNIIKYICPKPGQSIIEIGPGYGAITKILLQAVGEIEIIEFDKNLINILKNNFFLYTGLNIYKANILFFDFYKLKKNENLRIIGNIPYNISTNLIFNIFKKIEIIKDIHFMLQKEVYLRIIANPGNKKRGILSLIVQYYCKIFLLFDVPPNVFFPKPNVNSTFIKLEPYKKLPYIAKNYNFFINLVKKSFLNRRKNLRNNLKGLIDESIIYFIGIDPNRRPETLTIAEFVNLANGYLCMY